MASNVELFSLEEAPPPISYPPAHRESCLSRDLAVNEYTGNTAIRSDPDSRSGDSRHRLILNLFDRLIMSNMRRPEAFMAKVANSGL